MATGGLIGLVAVAILIIALGASVVSLLPMAVAAVLLVAVYTGRFG
ncbi:hypothetical protein DSM112329_01113 [Paraconexibacter sp. AEG42_29]|uniref:Uncharacterized protein n=2 Tax=Paraconexibacter sp. AEG42_29 TaxID=2997339 RepID=A0AAU7ARM0_9ACTN